MAESKLPPLEERLKDYLDEIKELRVGESMEYKGRSIGDLSLVTKVFERKNAPYKFVLHAISRSRIYVKRIQ